MSYKTIHFVVVAECFFTAIVKNVEVDTLSATAVRVSWDRVVLPEVNGYIVYYAGDRKRKSITVTSSVNSVDIEGLLDTLEYEFRVAVIAEINGKEFIGDIPLDLNLFEAISENIMLVLMIQY